MLYKPYDFMNMRTNGKPLVGIHYNLPRILTTFSHDWCE
jgi:hypothetical protein